MKQEIEQLARLLAWRELALRYLDLKRPLSTDTGSFLYLHDFDRLQIIACILDYDVLLPKVKLWESASDFVDIAVRFASSVKMEDKGEAAEFIENWYKIN